MKNKISYLIAAAAVAGLAQVASATPSLPAGLLTADPTDAGGLYIYDTANGSSDFVGLSGTGVSTTAFSDANWAIVVAIGDTVAGGVNPTLDLDVDAVGAGSLEVFYSVTGLGPTSNGYVFAAGAPVGGTASIAAYGGNSNSAFDLSNPLGATGTISSSSLYSLTLADTLTGSIASLDTSISVPDGGTTVMLLGAVLSGLALLKRKLVA
jgi:hypothetical protein